LLNTISITPKSEDKYVEKVFNSTELHFSEVTSFKIGTLRPKIHPRRELVVLEELPDQAVPLRKSLEIVKLVAVHPRRSLRQHHWRSRQGIIHCIINYFSLMKGNCNTLLLLLNLF
jgi:hypothetical protein